jgi:hypothetical protein
LAKIILSFTVLESRGISLGALSDRKWLLKYLRCAINNNEFLRKMGIIFEQIESQNMQTWIFFFQICHLLNFSFFLKLKVKFKLLKQRVFFLRKQNELFFLAFNNDFEKLVVLFLKITII